jgi:hypothetical protein
VRIVHGPKAVRILGLVLLDVCHVYPLDRLHEANILISCGCRNLEIVRPTSRPEWV